MKLQTLLFAPADSERKIGKALASSADVVILDLEDSVAPSAKAAARILAATQLAGLSEQKRLVVRVNPRETPWYIHDLSAVVPHGPSAILLPKCTGPEDLLALDHHLEAFEVASGRAVGSTGILALVTETAASLANMSYAGVTRRLQALLFGAEDLAADFGISPRSAEGTFTVPVSAARAALLVAAAQAKVSAIDTPWPDPRDPCGLKRETDAAVRDGFVGKLCIHPDQLTTVRQAFAPPPDRVKWAESVCRLFKESPSAGVLVLDGKMIDRPHLRLAERILEAASDT